ncbi:MAG: LacI family DNA-binding transcriptional regulator [Roseibium sp.]
MAARVTIKTIAKDLGISHMTVSRALSDNPNVLKETKYLVKKRAAELGYVKIAAATAMRGDGTKIVGLLLPNIVNEFYAKFANDLASICESYSFQLIIHLTNDDARTERNAIQQLREVQAKAVVVVPAPADDGDHVVEPQHLDNLEVIQLIRQRPMTGAETTIAVEDAKAISDAVRHLHSQGHSKIAYIGANAKLSSGRNRLAAYRLGLESCNLKVTPALEKTDSPSFDMGAKATKEILSENQATAIVCAGFEISNGALNALLTSGKRPGSEIAFIGYGDPSFYTWIEGGISTIRVPVTPLAEQTLDILRNHPGRNELQKVFEFDAELVIRNT